jgi:hypothetical protein
LPFPQEPLHRHPPVDVHSISGSTDGP